MKFLRKWSSKVETRQNLQEYFQLQTVLALYEQENIRNNEQPSLSRLKTSVKRHIDQTRKTQNLRARNETIERGAVTKRQKEKPAQKGNWENAISGKQVDNVRRETHAVSDMTQHLGTDARGDKKDSRPLLHKRGGTDWTERYPQKVQAADVGALLEQEAEFRAEISLRVGHPPVCP